MKTSIISAPKHWSKADVKDIEREIVGLIDDRPTACVQVVAVRALTYGAKWVPLKNSRAIRRNMALEVRWQ